MRKMVTTLCIALFSIALHAQTEQTYTQAFDSAFINISRTQATTGILYERVVPFAQLYRYNSQIAPADTGSRLHFVQAYSELYRAAFNPAVRFPLTVEELQERTRGSWRGTGTIDAGLMLCRFNMMDSVVGKQKLMFTADSVLIENPAITASLYQENKAFVAAVFVDTVYGTGASLRFKDSLRFNNTGLSVSLLQVDCGDGLGLRTIGSNAVLFIPYTQSGVKILRFVATFSNGQSFTAYARVYFKYAVAPPLAKGSGHPNIIKDRRIDAKITFTDYGGATAKGEGVMWFYFSQNNDTLLRKPILIVDGFDPGNMRQPEKYAGEGEGKSIWELLEYKDSMDTLRHAGEQFIQQGYDLVILDLPDGGGYIERNAMVCIEAINEINRRLAASGSTEEIVVVGPSMGGQITRYALAYMEQNRNEYTNYGKHNCRLWVSFDSPHQGANIAIGAQAFLKFFGYVAGSEGAKKSWESTVCCTAAQQMLIVHALPSASGMFNRYYSDLKAMGYPSNLRKVAVASGSLNGTPNGVDGNEVMDIYAKTISGGSLNVAKIRLFPASGQSVEVFRGTYAYLAPLWHWLLGFGAFETKYVRESCTISAPNNGVCGLDAAPGGVYNTFEKIYEEAVKDPRVKPIQMEQVGHCFMPITSTLDLNRNVIPNYCTDISHRDMVAEKLTPFGDYWGPVNKNMDHVLFDPDLYTWFINEIDTYVKGSRKIPLCGTANYAVHLPAGAATPSIAWKYSSNLRLVAQNGPTAIFRAVAQGDAWVQATVSSLGGTKELARYAVNVSPYESYPAAPDVISQNTTWDSPLYIEKNVTVSSGSTLTINTTVAVNGFSRSNYNANIIVEPGGHLVLGSRCLLTNLCEGAERWQGILVQGNPHLPQTYQQQGTIDIRPGAVIENAVTAVSLGTRDDYSDSGGGFIRCDGATFRNNAIAVYFSKYRYPHKRSSIEATDFILDDSGTLGGSPTFIWLEDVSQVSVLGCSFTDTRENLKDLKYSGCYGIQSDNSSFTVDQRVSGGAIRPSGFTNLYRGILSYPRGLSPQGGITVRNSQFTGNYGGIYIASFGHFLSSVNIFHNRFQVKSIPDYKTYGIYTSDAHGFRIEENEFYTSDSAAQSGVGLVITSTNGFATTVYKNTFHHLLYGSLAQGHNQTGATGLCYQCNVFYDNYIDIGIPRTYDWRISETGIAKYQVLGDNQQNVLANNVFRSNRTGGNADMVNQLSPIYYVYNSAPTAYRTQPVCGENINLIGMADPLQGNKPDCPGKIDVPVTPHTIAELYAQAQVVSDKMNHAKTQKVQAEQELGLLLDGGSTGDLAWEVATAMPPDALDLRNELLHTSPYVSDTIMGLAINKETVLNDGMLRDVMVANSHAAKNDTLMQLLEDRNMPAYMMDQIAEGKEKISTKEVLEIKRAFWHREYEQAFRELVSCYLNDTLLPAGQRSDSIVALLARFHTPESYYELALWYHSQENYTQAEAVLQSISQQFTLNGTQLQRYQYAVQLFEIVKERETTGVDTLTAEQLSILNTIVNSRLSVVASIAKAILCEGWTLYEPCFYEEIYYPEAPREMAGAKNEKGNRPVIRQEPLLTIQPNPARQCFTARYKLEETPHVARLLFTDLRGMILQEKPLSGMQDQLLFEVQHHPEGLYFLRLEVNGKLRETAKVVIVK